MVCGKYRRPLFQRFAINVHPDPDDAQHKAVVIHGKHAGHARPEPDEELLHRHQRKRDTGKGQQHQRGAEPAHRHRPLRMIRASSRLPSPRS